MPSNGIAVDEGQERFIIHRGRRRNGESREGYTDFGIVQSQFIPPLKGVGFLATVRVKQNG